MRVVWLMLALACALPWLACEKSISADDYDRTCLQNEECMLIRVGPICSCECEFGAISSEDGGQYLEDRGELTCDEQCDPCPTPEVWCDDRTCAVKED